MFINIPLSFLWDEKELERIVLIIAPVALFIAAWWKIYQKAGYPGWLALLWFIPGVNLVLFFVFAFSRWPLLKRLPTITALMASEIAEQAIKEWKLEHQKDFLHST